MLKYESIGYEDPAYLSLSTTNADALVLRESSGMLTLIHSPATEVDSGRWLRPRSHRMLTLVDGGFLICRSIEGCLTRCQRTLVGRD